MHTHTIIVYILCIIALITFTSADESVTQVVQKHVEHLRRYQADQPSSLFLGRELNKAKSDLEFVAPTMHPFQSRSELFESIRNDAFGGFDHRIYSHDLTFHEWRHVQETHLAMSKSSIAQDALVESLRRHAPRRFARALRHQNIDSAATLKRLVKSFEPSSRLVADTVEHIHPITGSATRLNYKARVLTGVVLLDREEDVLSVTCPDSQTLRLTASSWDKIRQWIPGTRLIIGQGWQCEPNQKGPIYRLIVTRRKISDDTVEYHTIPLKEQDLTLDSKYELTHTVGRRIDEHVVDFYDSAQQSAELLREQCYSGKPMVIDAWTTSMDGQSRSEGEKKRQSIDTSRSFDLLNYNYDKNSRRAKKEIDFYTYRSSTTSVRVACTNCYGYIGFNMKFKMETSWLSIDILKAEVSGEAKFSFETLFDLGYSYTRTFDKNDFLSYKLPSIKFSVGMIPVYIEPTVSLSASVFFTVNAKLQVTHLATFTSSLRIGIEYTSKYGFKRIDDRGYPRLVVERPKISQDSQATLDCTLTLKPKLRLNFYSVAPLDFVFFPHIRLTAQVGNALCGRAGAQFNTYWGLAFGIQMQPLQINKDVYLIGGKSYDFGGALPYPKRLSDSKYILVHETPIRCSYCSGCVDLLKLWKDARSRYAPLTSFREATQRAIAPRSTTGSDQVTDVELGTSSTKDLSIEASQCHIYKVSGQFLPTDPAFTVNGADSRQIQVSVSSRATLKVYWDANETPVRQKTSQSGEAQPDAPLSVSEGLETLYISMCNEGSSNTNYEFDTFAAATIEGMDNIHTPVLSMPKLHRLILTFREKSSISQYNHVLITMKQIEGDVDAVVTARAVKSSDQSQMSTMDRAYLFDTAHKNVEEISLNLDTVQYPHQDYDYVVTADIMPREHVDIDRIQFFANHVHKIDLRQPIVPQTDLIQIYRTEADPEDIMQYMLHVKRSTSASQRICAFTGQISTIELSDSKKTCWDLTTDSASLPYKLSHEDVLNGYDYFMLQIEGNFGAITELSVDELLYTRSGQKSVFRVRNAARGGDRFILKRNSENVGDKKHDDVLFSGRSYLDAVTPCTIGCSTDMKVLLIDNSDGHMKNEKWSHSWTTNPDGTYSFDLDFTQVAAAIGETVEQVRSYRIVVDVAAHDANSPEFEFHLFLDELRQVSYSESTVTGLNSFNDHVYSGEMMFYKIPKNIVNDNQYHGLVVSITPLESPETKTIGNPEIFVQKSSLPRFGNFLMNPSDMGTQNRFAFYMNEEVDYYVGITTSSQELSYKVSFTPLEPAAVKLSYASGEEMSFSEAPTLKLKQLREDGLRIRFVIDSQDHRWNPALVEPLPSTTAKKLLKIFSGNQAEWKELYAYLEDALIDAFNPNSRTNPYSFMQVSAYELIINVPAMKNLKFSGDMVITASPELQAGFFTTQDPRNQVSSGERFKIEGESSNARTIGLIILAVSLCGFGAITVIGTVLVGVIVFGALGGKKKSTNKTEQPVYMKEGLLRDDEQELFAQPQEAAVDENLSGELAAEQGMVNNLVDDE